MPGHRSLRASRALVGAFTLLMLPGLGHAAAGGVNPAPGADAPAQAAPRCGQVEGGVFGLVDTSVDPVARGSFTVAGRVYQSSAFDLVTLAVFELAWIGHQDVCIEEDVAQKPVGATASVDVCGDAIVGATVWPFVTGSGELDANGKSNERMGFIHNALMGFDPFSVQGDPTPPNFMSALRVAVDYKEPDDCIVASVTWTAPANPVVAASLTTSECLVTSRNDSDGATFTQPANSWTYAFSLTPGSSISSVFEADELGGVKVTAKRGINGSVSIVPVLLAGCPDARADAAPAAPLSTPTPTTRATPTPSVASSPSPSPSPSPTTSPSPSPSADPSPTASVESPMPAHSASDGATAGAVVANLGSTDPGSPGDPTSALEPTGPPLLGLLVAALLVAAGAGLLWQVARRGPRRSPAGAQGSIADASLATLVASPEPAPSIALADAGLTPREREVLAMVADGLTNREIGSALFITESTAGVHVSNILGKLGVDSRTEAARYAIKAGINPSATTGRFN